MTDKKPMMKEKACYCAPMYEYPDVCCCEGDCLSCHPPSMEDTAEFMSEEPKSVPPQHAENAAQACRVVARVRGRARDAERVLADPRMDGSHISKAREILSDINRLLDEEENDA